jgi:hypothetical protein
MFFSVNPPLASIFASFGLLGDPASFARGSNTHPLLSLVSYQLFSPCYFTHPKAPTDQGTYLHRRHQQHQPTRLIQENCTDQCLLEVHLFKFRIRSQWIGSHMQYYFGLWKVWWKERQRLNTSIGCPFKATFVDIPAICIRPLPHCKPPRLKLKYICTCRYDNVWSRLALLICTNFI